MTHDELGGVGESGTGNDHDHRREPDGTGGGGGTPELGDAGGAELAQRGGEPAQPDGASTDADQRAADPRVAPPPNQPPLPITLGLQISQQRFHFGPIPSAIDLAEYERYFPGLGRQIVAQAFANQESDRRINEQRVDTSRRLDLRGQWWAGGLCSGSTACALASLFLLHPPWLAISGAGIFGVGALAPVVSAFLRRGGTQPGDAPPPAPPPQPPAIPDNPPN